MKQSTETQIKLICWLGIRHIAMKCDLKQAVWIDESGRIWMGEELRVLLPHWLVTKSIPTDLFNYLLHTLVYPLVFEWLKNIGEEIEQSEYLLNNLNIAQASWTISEFSRQTNAKEFFAFHQKCERTKRKKFKNIVEMGQLVKFV